MNKQSDRFRIAQVSVWAAFCVFPACMVSMKGRHASASALAVSLTRSSGHSLATYLSYSPEPLLIYLLPSLELASIFMLLGCIRRAATIRSANPSTLARALSAALGDWAALNLLALFALAIACRIGQGDLDAFSWAWRFWFTLMVVGLPALGVGCVAVASTRTWLRAVLAGLTIFLLFGLLGIVARWTGFGWMPGALSEAFLLSSGQSSFRAVFAAIAWLVALAAIAIGIGRAKQRNASIAAQAH